MEKLLIVSFLLLLAPIVISLIPPAPAVNDPCDTGNCDTGLVCQWDAGNGNGICKALPLAGCNGTGDCVSGTECSDDVCALPLDSGCIDNIQCRMGTVCDSLFCKLEVNEACTLGNGECMSGTTCTDLATDLCKLEAGENCTDYGYDDCTTSYVCHEKDNECKLEVNENCVLGDNKCRSGAVCTQLVGDVQCKLEAGENCTDYGYDDCTTSYVCHDQDNICKLEVNEDCILDDDKCRFGADCTQLAVDVHCKLEADEICDGYGYDGCVDGYVCHADDNECKLEVNEICSSNDDNCRSGAVCTELGDDDLCKLEFDEECVVGDGKCTSGTVCTELDITDLCKYDLGEDCDTEADCTGDYVCPDGGDCKLNFNADCDANPDQCMSGTVCTDLDPDLCKRVYNENCNGDEDCTGIYVCPDDENQCKLDLNDICVLATSECRTGTTCTDLDDPDLCKLDAGEVCTENAYDDCTTGNVCHEGDNVCKLEFNQGCNVGGNECRSGTVCTELGATDLCKKNPGEGCSDTADCTTDYFCAAEMECKLQVNEVCNPGINYCRTGTNCVSVNATNKCKLTAGVNCTDYVYEDCIDGYVCHADDNVCKLEFDQECVVGDNKCRSGTVCSELGATDLCKYDLGEDCDTEADCAGDYVCPGGGDCKLDFNADCDNSDQCMSGTVCTDLDPTDLCKREADEVCGYTEDCTDGYVCHPDDFQCKLDVNGICSDDAQCRSGAACADLDPQDLCKLEAGTDCTFYNYNDCVDGYVCHDEDNECRLGLNEDCSGSGPCRSGTVCTSFPGPTEFCKLEFNEICSLGGNQCTSGTVCTDLEPDDLCKLEADEGCSDSDDCTDDYVCHPDDGECKMDLNGICSDDDQCRFGTACADLDPSDLCKLESGAPCDDYNDCIVGYVCHAGDEMCKLELNEDCNGTFSDQCRSGTVCTDLTPNDKCKLEFDEICSLGAGHCTSGTVCTDLEPNDLCKLAFNEICSLGADQCTSGTVCTDLEPNDLCKREADEVCSESDECTDDHVCHSDDLVCKLGLNEICSDNDQCRSGTACADLDPQDLCKLEAGEVCTEYNYDDCIDGYVCHDDDNECKLDVNEICSLGDDQCRSGTDCTNISPNDLCRVPLLSSCDDDSECVPWALCDSVAEVCKLRPGQSCDSNDDDNDCVSTTICQQDTCKLKAGESCEGAEEFCMENAVCTGLACNCDMGLTYDPDLIKCSGGPAMTMVSVLMVAACFVLTRLI